MKQKPDKTIKLSQIKASSILGKVAFAMIRFHGEYCCIIGNEKVRIVKD